MTIEEIKNRIRGRINDIEMGFGDLSEEELMDDQPIAYDEYKNLEWVLDILSALEEENNYAGQEHTRQIMMKNELLQLSHYLTPQTKGESMGLSCINIIRTRWNEDDVWRYEICSEDDLDDYYTCESGYSYLQSMNNVKLEVIYSGDINFSREILDRLIDQLEDVEEKK